MEAESIQIQGRSALAGLSPFVRHQPGFRVSFQWRQTWAAEVFYFHKIAEKS